MQNFTEINKTSNSCYIKNVQRKNIQCESQSIKKSHKVRYLCYVKPFAWYLESISPINITD